MSSSLMERCNPRQFHQNQVLSGAKARLFLTVWSNSKYFKSVVKKILKKYSCWKGKITWCSNSISLQKRTGGNMFGKPSCGCFRWIMSKMWNQLLFLLPKKEKTLGLSLISGCPHHIHLCCTSTRRSTIVGGRRLELGLSSFDWVITNLLCLSLLFSSLN